MKIKNILLATAAVCFTLFSCISDKEYSYEEKTALSFDAKIAKSTPQARALNSTWEKHDAIGIFMTEGAGLATPVVGEVNKHFVTSEGDGKFDSKTAADLIYFPKDVNKEVNFISYYPYLATLPADNIYNVNVTNQASQPAIDLMYSDNAKNLKSGAVVQMEFVHQLTKVVFNIEGINGLTSLAGLKVEIDNLAGKAKYDLSSKALTPEALTERITLLTVIDATEALKAVSEGIVIPTAALASRKFYFTIDVAGVAKEFTWDAGTQPFGAGKKNTYPVTLDAKLGVQVQPGATIKPWENGSSENIEIDLGGGTVEAGDGTLAKPYSVTEVKTKTGESAKWVTGYIVGSTAIGRAIGTPSKTNILLAAKADETDESKCFIVDIAGSAVQDNLDIVTNTTLVGKLVKVQGNIVNNIFGGLVAMTAVTAQEGGATVTPPGPGPGAEVVMLKETFGVAEKPWTSNQIAIYTKYDNGAPIVYTDPYGTWADIRTVDGISNIWFPASLTGNVKEAGFKIAGLEAGCTDIVLTYNIASQKVNVDGNIIAVKADGVLIPVPSTPLGAVINAYSTVTLNLPDNTTTVEFYSGAINENAYRVANIKIVGKK